MINYKVHSLENGSSFIRKVKTDRTTNVLKKSPKGILRCHWPLKYLNERPALVIHFLNIDIRQPLLPDKRAEYESKISSIRLL
jgi:hypothetical protein